MNVYSWNVNGIRAAEKKDFLPWLISSGADLVCLQETKAFEGQLSSALKTPEAKGAAYRSCWASAKKPGYSGTAVYYKTEPEDVFFLGDSAFDDEGRVLGVRYGKLAVISAYFPNSQDGGARLGYKLDFCAAILEFCQSLVSRGMQVVLCGDYNIAHKPIDLKHPKTNEGNPGYLPEERAWMDAFTSSGFADTFRHFCKDADQYTWWSYRFHAREKNVGWRIDYHCVNEGLLPAVKSSTICPTVFGSDHCPIKLELDEKAAG
jgi:exodeoxyribonuclease-3